MTVCFKICILLAISLCTLLTEPVRASEERNAASQVMPDLQREEVGGLMVAHGELSDSGTDSSEAADAEESQFLQECYEKVTEKKAKAFFEEHTPQDKPLEKYLLMQYWQSFRLTFLKFINAFRLREMDLMKAKLGSIDKLIHRGFLSKHSHHLYSPMCLTTGGAVQFGVGHLAHHVIENSGQIVKDAVPSVGKLFTTSATIILNYIREVKEMQKVHNFKQFADHIMIRTEDYTSEFALKLLEERLQAEMFEVSTPQEAASLAVSDVLKIVVKILKSGYDRRPGNDERLMKFALDFVDNPFIGKCDNCQELILDNSYHCSVPGCKRAEICASCVDWQWHKHSAVWKHNVLEAAKSGTLQQVKQLIEMKANMLCEWPSGLYPTVLQDRTVANDVEAVAILIQANVDVNQVGDYNKEFIDKPPLYLAAERGYMGIVQLLIEAKAETTYKNLIPVLVYALRLGRTKVARSLIEHKADVNATFRLPRWKSSVHSSVGSSRYTPLMVALQNGIKSTVTDLILAGADVQETRRLLGASDSKISKKTKAQLRLLSICQSDIDRGLQEAPSVKAHGVPHILEDHFGPSEVEGMQEIKEKDKQQHKEKETEKGKVGEKKEQQNRQEQHKFRSLKKVEREARREVESEEEDKEEDKEQHKEQHKEKETEEANEEGNGGESEQQQYRKFQEKFRHLKEVQREAKRKARRKHMLESGKWGSLGLGKML